MTTDTVAGFDAIRAALPIGLERDPADYVIEGVTPAAAFEPREREEVAALLRLAADHGHTVVPQGARTAMAFGCQLESYDIALDLQGLRRTVEYVPDDLTVTVEAGRSLQALQAELAEHGQYLTIDTPPDDRVTIGGLLATARPGAWRGHLPPARDLILGMQVALPSGELVRSGGRVVKNVTGYDLQRLHTGALGAFGVILEATFKVAPLPAAVRTLATTAPTIEAATTLARRIWDAGPALRALTVLAPAAASRAALDVAPTVLVELAGGTPAVDRSARDLAAVASMTEASEASWAALRHLHGDADTTVLRLGLPPTAMAEVLVALEESGANAWAHLAAGAVLACLPAPEDGDATTAVAAIERWRALARARGGFLVVESAPIEVRARLDAATGDPALVAALRDRFDPHRVLNRGRWGARAVTGLRFVGPDVPTAEDLANCIHCGFCLPTCPTYVATGQELESPRGRLHLISGIRDGRIETTPRTLQHLDLCLQCRACETACPSAVPYGRIMEDARASIMANAPAAQPRTWRLRTLLLRHVVARPARLRAALTLGRWYARTGLRGLVHRHLAPRLPASLRRLEASTPTFEASPFRQTGTLAAPKGATTRVAMLLGCLHGDLYPDMHRATVTALAHAGCEVVAPPEQVCCGALHAHAGDAETARALARRNIAAFDDAGIEAVIVNAAGCGAAMKEYGRLLRHDPHWSARAEAFAARVKDVLEFVAERDFAHDLGPVERTVTLQDACHLAHAQRIREAPRRILRAIPGLTLAEMVTPDRCCGSAGLYSMVQPDMSARVLEPKMAAIAATGAATVCTANPGCTLQLETGARRHDVDVDVRHVIQLLAESIEAARS